MKKLSVSRRMAIMMAVSAMVSCKYGRQNVEITYTINLTEDQIYDFKDGLGDYAEKNDYIFIDNSYQTRESREYINRVSIGRNGKSAGLTDGEDEVVDVTIRHNDKRFDFFISAQTSALNAREVYLTIIHDRRSDLEKEMVASFLRSQFLLSWKQAISDRKYLIHGD